MTVDVTVSPEYFPQRARGSTIFPGIISVELKLDGVVDQLGLKVPQVCPVQAGEIDAVTKIAVCQRWLFYPCGPSVEVKSPFDGGSLICH